MCTCGQLKAHSLISLHVAHCNSFSRSSSLSNPNTGPPLPRATSASATAPLSSSAAAGGGGVNATRQGNQHHHQHHHRHQPALQRRSSRVQEASQSAIAALLQSHCDNSPKRAKRASTDGHDSSGEHNASQLNLTSTPETQDTDVSLDESQATPTPAASQGVRILSLNCQLVLSFQFLTMHTHVCADALALLLITALQLCTRGNAVYRAVPSSWCVLRRGGEG